MVSFVLFAFLFAIQLFNAFFSFETCYMLLVCSIWSVLIYCQWTEFNYFTVFLWFLCAFSGRILSFIVYVSCYVRSTVLLFHWMCRHCIHSLTSEIANQNVWNLAEISIASFSHTLLFIITRTVLYRWMFTKSNWFLSAAAVVYRFDNWSDLTWISRWLTSVCWSAYLLALLFVMICE